MIRPFEMRDLNAVLDIWLRTTIAAHPFIEKEHFLAGFQTFQEDHLLRSQSQVYEIEGKVVGFVSIKQDMTVTAINVDFPYRKSGIGEALMNRLIDKFQQISVKCYMENIDALGFFSKLGFEAVKTETDPETNQEVIILTIDGQRQQKRS